MNLRKLSRAHRKVKVECSRGAKIKDIHEKANEFLASGQIDGNTALIVHCGTNDLAVENKNTAATKLPTLINGLKPKTRIDNKTGNGFSAGPLPSTKTFEPYRDVCGRPKCNEGSLM